MFTLSPLSGSWNGKMNKKWSLESITDYYNRYIYISLYYVHNNKYIQRMITEYIRKMVWPAVAGQRSLDMVKSKLRVDGVTTLEKLKGHYMQRNQYV